LPDVPTAKEKGYNILKMKRDGLILEFFRVLEEAKTSRGELQGKYRTASEMISLSNTVEGTIGLKAAAFSVRDIPEITLKPKNIMGVLVPEITSTKVKKKLLERGVIAVHSIPAVKNRTLEHPLKQSPAPAPFTAAEIPGEKEKDKEPENSTKNSSKLLKFPNRDCPNWEKR
jgi:V/A-type H+-transporting ATPase subunit D